MKSLKGSDVFIVSLISLSFFASSYMLYRDIFLSSASTSGAQVGTVTYKNRYAEQKTTGTNLWGTLAQNAPVFNKDTIRTGSGSSATIHLDDKTEITLGEDSMVFIDLTDQKATLKHSGGSLVINSPADSSPVVLQTASGDVTLSGGKLQVSDSTDGVNLAVTGGKVRIKNDKKNTDTIVGKNVSYSILSGTTSVASAIPVSPSAGEYIDTKDELKTVTFKWDTMPSANAAARAATGTASGEAPTGANTKIVIARDSAFRKIVTEETGVASGAEIALPAGNYYWKIDGSTESSWFSVNRAGAPRLIAPVNARFARMESPLRISFSWSKPVNGELYRIEIYRSMDKSKPMISKTVNQRNVSFQISEPGDYTWKVITLAGPNQIEFASAEAAFSIEDGKLIPPAIIKSGNGKTDEPIQATTLAVAEKKPVASWEAVTGADSYRVVISSDIDGKSILRNVRTDTNMLTLSDPLPAGNYYISVSSATKNGTSIPSKPMRFDIVFTRPVEPLEPTIDAGTTAEKAAVTLQWKDDSGADNYRALVSASSDFSSPLVDTTTKKRTLMTALPEIVSGTVYFQIETLDAANRTVATTSAIAMSINKKTAAPVPEYPTQGTRIEINAMESFTFKWKALSDAREYTIGLYRMSGDMQTKIGEWKTTGVLFTLEKPEILSFGNFAWDLSADGSDKIRSFFSIYQKNRLSAPKIRTMTTKGEY